MYRNWVKSNIPLNFLLILTLLAIMATSLVETTRSRKKHSRFNKQIEAANLMQKSMQKIAKARYERSISINEELDPNSTGMIGRKEFTPITTTIGNLEAKRTSTNPDFAALMVKYFDELNLQKGDTIAIGGSGSFPALILASLSAAKVMEVEPLLIYSIGASHYGANIPEFTFIDMLEVLNKEKLIPYEPIAISLGGSKDRAAGLLSEDRKKIFELANGYKYPLIYEESVSESVKLRMNYYDKYVSNELKCFINIGGAAANLGSSQAALNLTSGLIKEPFSVLLPQEEDKTVIFEFISRNKPVINLLNIKDLATVQGISTDPIPLPSSGKSEVYFEEQYNITLSIILTILILGMWILLGYNYIIRK